MTTDLFEASNVRRVYAVSELTAEARFAIEERFPQLWVEGEVTNFRRPASGHWYFSLADARAQLRCAMFASSNRSVRTRIGDGMRVLIRCRLSLYEGRGEFQAIVDHVEPAGEGALRAAFDRLRAQLERDGLFAAERKRTPPVFPRRIGVVSSLSGAALQDVLAVLRRRFPCVDVLCLPVAVQGYEAAPQIVAALERAHTLAEPPDVLLVTRGGGSLEDLAAFNSEPVARAIARCTIPVVSAVGHETDVTIADLVADRRAPTPSAAAELVTPDGADLAMRIRTTETRLARRVLDRLRADRRVLGAVSARLVDPARALEQQMQRADELRERLVRATRERLAAPGARLAHVRRMLDRSNPVFAIEAARLRTARASDTLRGVARRTVHAADAALAATVRTLNAVSPLATLDRGYAIVARPDGTRWGAVVSDAGSLAPGERIHAHLASGTVAATVYDTPAPPAALLARRDTGDDTVDADKSEERSED